jgi:hypothetical protein
MQRANLGACTRSSEGPHYKDADGGKRRNSDPSGKYRNAEQSEYRPLRKMPEHRTVEIPTRSETSEIQPERKTSGNLDIRKKGAGPVYRPDTKEDRAG